MPELPEVEFCRQSLAAWTTGRAVQRVEVLDGRIVRDSRNDRPSAGSALAAERLVRIARRPIGLQRHGKRLLWRFEHGALLLHLGMTGRWTRAGSPFAKVALHLDDGSALTFHDPRLLGGIVPFDSLDAGLAALHEGLGPDASTPLPPVHGARAIKLVLMDQSVVAGLGNVQAMEALWRAGVHPQRAAASLTASEHARLSLAITEQLAWTQQMLDGGPDGEVVYVEERGAPNPFQLYQREGAPCPRCAVAGRRGVIATFRQAGRGTWWCPGCQGGDTEPG